MKIIYLTVTICLVMICNISFAQDCDALVERKPDRFKDEVDFRSIRFRSEWGDNIRFMKVIKSGNPHYYLILTMTVDEPGAGLQGAYILFENGKKMLFETADVDVEVSKDIAYGHEDFIYESYIKINMTQLKMFQTSPVTHFKLYAYEYTVASSQADHAKNIANCLIGMK